MAGRHRRHMRAIASRGTSGRGLTKRQTKKPPTASTDEGDVHSRECRRGKQHPDKKGHPKLVTAGHEEPACRHHQCDRQMLRHRRLEFVRACQGAKDRHGRPGDERGRLPDGDGVACNGGHEQTEGPKETDGQEVFAEDGHDARQSEKNTGRLDVKQLQVGEMTFQHVRSP